MDDDDTILMNGLTVSYQSQLVRYRSLRDVVRQLMSKLILSRGDLSGMIASMEKKQLLLKDIEIERDRIAPLIARWETRKALVSPGPGVELLNTVLQQVTDAIREFLDEEDQLRKYIEKFISSKQPVSTKP